MARGCRRLVFGISALLGSSGCVADNTLTLLWPVIPEAHTAVVWDELNLWAAEVDGEIRFSKRSTASNLWAALYAQDLPELGLSAGALGPPSCERSCDLLSPLSIIRSPIDEEGSTFEWVDVTDRGLPEELAKALLGDLGRCGPCSDFQTDFLQIPAPRMINIKVATEVEGTVVVGTSDGALYGIDQSLTPTRICTANGTSVSDGAYGPDGLLWVTGSRGLSSIDLSTQIPDNPCTVETSTSPSLLADEAVGAIAVSAEGEPYEIWCLTDRGRLFRFSGSEFSHLGTLPPGVERLPSLSRLGPGRGFAAMAGDAVLRVKDNIATTRNVSDLIAGSHIRALAAFDGVDLAILLDESGMLIDDGGQLVLHASPDWDSPGTSIPHRGGLLMSMNSGRMIEYFSGFGFCPSVAGFTNETVYRMARLSEDRVIFADIISLDPEASAVGVVTTLARPCE